MKKIRIGLIIIGWMMLMVLLLPVSLVGGISARLGEWINQQFRVYLESYLGGWNEQD